MKDVAKMARYALPSLFELGSILNPSSGMSPDNVITFMGMSAADLFAKINLNGNEKK